MIPPLPTDGSRHKISVPWTAEAPSESALPSWKAVFSPPDRQTEVAGVQTSQPVCPRSNPIPLHLAAANPGACHQTSGSGFRAVYPSNWNDRPTCCRGALPQKWNATALQTQSPLLPRCKKKRRVFAELGSLTFLSALTVASLG